MSGYKFQLTEEDAGYIDQQVKDFQKDYKDTEIKFDPRPVVAYLQEGSHLIRIYPDTDEKGKPRFYRRIYIHSRAIPLTSDGKGKRRFCWADSRVDNLLTKLEDKGLKKVFGEDLWKFKSQEQGILCAHFFESADKAYHPAGSTVALSLSPKQLNGFAEWLLSLHPKEKVMMFNPFEEAPGIRLQVSKGTKSNMSVGVDGLGVRRLALPMPPRLWDSNWKKEIEAGKDFNEVSTHEFISLSDLGRKETDTLTDEEFSIFEELCMRQFEEFRAKGGEKVDDSSVGKGRRPSENEERKELKVNSGNGAAKPVNNNSHRLSVELADPLPETGERECPLRNRINEKPADKEKFGPAVMFGNKPGLNNPKCMMCPNEKDCIKLTEANLKQNKQ